MENKANTENLFKSILQNVVNGSLKEGLNSLINIENIHYIDNVNYLSKQTAIALITKNFRQKDVLYSSLFLQSGVYIKNLSPKKELYNKLKKLQLKNYKNKCIFFQDTTRLNPYETKPVILFLANGIHFAGLIDGRKQDLFFKVENQFLVECEVNEVYTQDSPCRLIAQRDFP